MTPRPPQDGNLDSPPSGSLSWWQGWERTQWIIYVAATLAWMFDCMDQQIFNLTRDAAMEDLVKDKAAITHYATWATSIFMVGWAIGGLVFGALGDRFGRARMLTVTVLLYSLSTGLSALSFGVLDFCVYRFLTGLGVGGVFGLAIALVADAVPDRSRAPALGLLQTVSTVGNFTAAFAGIALGLLAARGIQPFGLAHWRLMFLIGALPALLCVLLLRHVPEPARWVLAKARSVNTNAQFGSYRTLLRHPKWSRRAWLGMIACSAGIIGLWGIGNFHPKIVGSIIEAEALDGGTTLAADKAYWRSLGLLLQNAGGLVGIYCLARLAHTWGRRPAFALGLLLSLASTILVFRYMRSTADMYWMLPIMGFGQLSVFGVYAVFLPELFPTGLRSTGASFCYNIGRLVAATAPLTLGQITQRLGGDIEGFRSAGIWVSLILLVGVAVIPLLPETKGQALPED